MTDALQLLRDDHRRVKELFTQFEEAGDRRSKSEIVKKALTELDIHAEIEEQIFYPAVRKESGTDEDMMDEAEEEHHVVKLLIAELRRMKPDAARFDAKFTVLAENVKHHIDEEESEMLPKAAELGMARMKELGAAMEERKAKLEKGGRTGVSTSAGRKARKPAGSAKLSPARAPASKGRSTRGSARRRTAAAATTRRKQSGSDRGRAPAKARKATDGRG